MRLSYDEQSFAVDEKTGSIGFLAFQQPTLEKMVAEGLAIRSYVGPRGARYERYHLTQAGLALIRPDH